jgi:drug/metabolite transporter (DMT)-like permease
MSNRRAEILLLIVTFLAAIGWVFSKNALNEFPAYQFVATRFLLAAAVLALFGSHEFQHLSKGQFLRSAATGTVFGFTLLVWVIALDETPFIGEGAFIISLSVVMVPLVGRIFFGSRITVQLLLALVPALLGLACLSLDNGFHLASYQWFFLVATLGFSLHMNLSNHFVKGIPPLALSAIQLGVAGFIAMIATTATRSWTMELSSVAWVWLLSSALIATSLRFALQTQALQTLMPSHASMIFLAEPVWTALLGMLLLGERMSSQQYLGCLLIFTALLVFRGDALIKPLLARNRQ